MSVEKPLLADAIVMVCTSTSNSYASRRCEYLGDRLTYRLHAKSRFQSHSGCVASTNRISPVVGYTASWRMGRINIADRQMRHLVPAPAGSYVNLDWKLHRYVICVHLGWGDVGTKRILLGGSGIVLQS